MSRYRQSGLNGNYAFQLSGVIADGMTIAFVIPSRVYERLNGKSESVITREVTESIRLIADETAGGVVLCSTGLKAKVKGVSLINNSVPAVVLSLDFPSGAEQTDSGTESGVRWIKYSITKYGVTKTYTLRESDQLTIEMDWGEGPDDTYKAIDQTKEKIMGGMYAFDCGDAIISCDYGEGSRVTNENNVLIGSDMNISMPDNFGVGSVVRAENLGTNTYKVPKSVENPSLAYNGSNYYLNGVTEWITLQTGRAYVCTAIELLGSTNSHIYIYSEAGGEVGRSIKEVYKKVENIDLSQLAKEAQATLNKNEIKQHVRNTAGDCIISDFIESVLAFEKDSGFPATDNDGEYIIDTDYNAEHSDSYHVGTIIRVGMLPQDEYSYHVASSVDERAPEYEGQGLHYNENGYIDGVTGSLEVKEGHYYRITGIYDCYDKYGLKVMLHVFTYEELEPSTITDLVKRAAEKLISEYRESAGSMIIATSAEYTAFKSHMQTQIANILTPILETE